jgi:hypothetical protein
MDPNPFATAKEREKAVKEAEANLDRAKANARGDDAGARLQQECFCLIVFCQYLIQEIKLPLQIKLLLSLRHLTPSLHRGQLNL